MTQTPDACWGRVLSARGGFYAVLTPAGELNCHLRGKLKRRQKDDTNAPNGVLVGDMVRVSMAEAMVEEIEPRKNALPRPRIANIELSIAVLAARDPAYDLLLLDKILLVAAHYGIEAAICFNKADLAKGELEPVLTLYRGLGYASVCASACTGQGLEDFTALLKDKISVLAGPSGVGKSSLLNRLLPDYQARVGEVSARLQRGRHTTRHVSLLPLPGGGLVADTPGFSLLDLPADLDKERLPLLYPEFAEPTAHCRFLGCLHREEPDCAVKQAVAAGRIDEGRYQRYLRFLSDIEEREVRY